MKDILIKMILAYLGEMTDEELKQIYSVIRILKKKQE